MSKLTAEEYESVAEYQRNEVLHKLTCPVCLEVLEPSESGLKCPRCRYRQDWVPDYVRDGRWRTWANGILKWRTAPAG